jgi:hypothetical protein
MPHPGELLPQRPPLWTAPTMINAWTSFGAPFAPIGFYKDADGFVHLRGMMTGGATPNPGFVLPAGYWPEGRCVFCTDSNGAHARLDVDATGNVIPVIATTFVTLDGLIFKAYR